MRKIVLLLSVIIASDCYSQIVFERGYFIDENDQRTDCLIKNLDWKNNPTAFNYRLSDTAEILLADIQTVKEFAIINGSRYIRAIVQIDRSSDDPSQLSADRNPVFFWYEPLWLKVLVEGRASLFQYKEESLTRYFFQVGDSAIRQLVYKRYVHKVYNRYIAEAVDKTLVLENDEFRMQLFLDTHYNDITMDDLRLIRYTEKDLTRHFVKYNQFSDPGFVYVKQKKDFFNLALRPGLSVKSLEIERNVSEPLHTDFDTRFNFRLGVETEFILPFNKNKWTIIAEPTYQYYQSETSSLADNVSGGIINTRADYKSIELPIGLRHYFFLKNESVIFVNASYILDYSIHSVVEFTRSDGSLLNSLVVDSRNNLAAGIGYKYKGRYILEFRYHTNRHILGDQVFWSSDYKNLSLVFGFSFL